MLNQLLSSLPKNPSSVTFLVGPNGSGKSSRLANLTTELIDARKGVIAISNTVFDKFTRSRRTGYVRLSPAIGRSYAVNVFKRALINTRSEMMRNSSLVAKTLQYMGFEPVLGLHIRINKSIDYENISRMLSYDIPEHEIDSVMRALKIYKHYESERQSSWIDLSGSQIMPERRELLTLLKYELRLKRLKIIEGISLTIERKGKIFDFDEASSGELSLLSSHAFIATNIQSENYILIDEPENSLHPRWQRDYCRRLLDQFYYYEPRIIIATHSPHIVQGAQNSEVDVRLIKLPLNKEAPEPLTKSIEGTLFEAFGVLSPASHYLSEKVTYLINELVQKRSTLVATQNELRAFQSLSDDEDQREFLNRSIELAEQAEAMLKARDK